MKAISPNLLALMAGALTVSSACAQSFSSGSDGSYGAINITNNTTLPLPPDGKFNATTISVASGVTLTFSRNLLNTPVYLLATGDVFISGTIDASGQSGNSVAGGLGGPGGFDGGSPGEDPSSIPPGAGFGPGAGNGGRGSTAVDGAGAGSYGAKATSGSSTNHGVIYGSPLLIPLVGGSGGGGTTGSPGTGGGGGGGAVLIASTTKITLNAGSHIYVRGGGSGGGSYNGGSGGAIRLVAPVISGNGEVNVYSNDGGGSGRIRIDTLDRSSLSLNFQPSVTASVGAAMFLFPSPLPKLDILQAAGTTIAEGTAKPVVVVLPFGTSPNQTVTVQARDFTGVVPINVVLTPENGAPTTYPAQIDMSSGNPATTTVNVVLPVNVRTVVNAWTR
jgi:hypothetical protein